MFGEGNTARPIGPRNRGRWIGTSIGCLLLATGVVLVSGTVDGLNLFGYRLADSTPSFSDPPIESPHDANETAVAATPANQTTSKTTNKKDLRSPAATRAKTAALAPKPRPMSTPSTRPPTAPPLNLKVGVNEVPAKPPCSLPGYAVAFDPPAEPVGAAFARSLMSSDLQTRTIEFKNGGFARDDADRILAGENPSLLGQIREGTLVVARLKTRERRITIDDAPRIEVAGTMDVAIVRDNCGTIVVQRHYSVFGRSVNETWEDSVRGLGEIFKEKIVDLVKR